MSPRMERLEKELAAAIAERDEYKRLAEMEADVREGFRARALAADTARASAEAALAEAREALKPFADAVQTGDDGEWSIVTAWPTTEDWTRARAALEQKP